MALVLDELSDKSRWEQFELNENINSLEFSNAAIKNNLRLLVNKNQLSTQNLLDSEDRTTNASRNTQIGEDLQITEEQADLDMTIQLRERLKMETRRLEEMRLQIGRDRTELNGLQAEFEIKDQSNRQSLGELREQKNEIETMRIEADKTLDSSLEGLELMRSCEAERERLEGRLVSRSKLLLDLQNSRKKAVETLQMMKDELKHAEQKEMDLLTQKEINEPKIHSLGIELASRTQQHKTDCNVVGLKIEQLEECCEEKKMTVSSLERGVAALLRMEKKMEMQLEMGEADMERSKVAMKRMLDAAREQNTLIRGDAERLRVEVMELRLKASTQAEAVLNTTLRLSELDSENETLMRAAIKSQSTVVLSEEGVDRIAIRERELVKANQDLAEDADELKRQVEEGSRSERDLSRVLTGLSSDKKSLKNEITHKEEALTALLKRIEEYRLA